MQFNTENCEVFIFAGNKQGRFYFLNGLHKCRNKEKNAINCNGGINRMKFSPFQLAVNWRTDFKLLATQSKAT